MSLGVTILILVLALMLIAIANWLERRGGPLGEPPLISYPVLQMAGLIIALIMIGHLVSLLTGHPFKGRWFS